MYKTQFHKTQVVLPYPRKKSGRVTSAASILFSSRSSPHPMHLRAML